MEERRKRMQEIHEKMKDMTPEEKKAFIKKMREEHGKKGGDRKKGDRKRGDKESDSPKKDGGVDPVRP